MSKKRFPYLLIILALIGSLSCQVVSSALQPPPAAELKQNTRTAEGAAKNQADLLSPTPPSPTLTFTTTPTALPPTSTATFTTTPTFTTPPTVAPLAGQTQTAPLTAPPPLTALPETPTAPAVARLRPSQLQLTVFEELWKAVHDEYLYRDFNGVDWDAVHQEYRQKIEAGLSPDDFYTAMGEMVARLGDDHSVYLNPKEVADEEAEFAGENKYVGVGVLSAAVPERSRVTVVVVFPDSPAEEAGLKPHDSILAVDGLPILEGDIDRRTNLRGPEGTQVTLTIQSPGGEPRQVALTRRRVLGSEPVPYSLLTSPAGKRIGYILLPTLANDTIIEKVKDALLALTAGSSLDGLILDNRQNPGGTDKVTRGTLSYFTKGTVGYFINRQGRNAFNIPGQDINGSQTVPLVVLVGKGTVSFGEIFSGILQDEGRATIIGELTDGNVEILWGYDFKDGSRAWLAHDTFSPINHPETNWEQNGIIPDINAASNWDEVDMGSDPAIKASLDYFEQKK